MSAAWPPDRSTLPIYQAAGGRTETLGNRMVLVPVLDLEEHWVSGERRWTGRAVLAGRINRPLLILTVGDRLVGVRNRCPHRPDMPMLRGRLEVGDRFLECPGHGWQMRLEGPELLGCPVVAVGTEYFLDWEA